MNLSGLSVIFKFVIIAIIYIIIFLALIIIYRDIKKPKKRTKPKSTCNFGFEVIDAGGNLNLRQGSIIPIQGQITIGRKQDNLLVLSDQYTSSYHAKVTVKNNCCFIADLNSTNGTFINEARISGEELLKAGDKVKIGSAILKVIS
ncbi:hypothetical protein C3495_01750 [Clostridiaceae bacterium 14S0207]|nr:hypothetical protein C3495_01750 [Clostridiaceae bacterium 14S0207]